MASQYHKNTPLKYWNHELDPLVPVCSNDPQWLRDLGQGISRLEQVFPLVGSTYDGSQTSFTLRYGGIPDGGRKNPGVEKFAGKFEGFCGVTDVDGNDRSFASLELEAALFQLALEELGVGPQLLDEFLAVRRIEQRKGGLASGGDRRGMRGGKQKGTSSQIKIVDEIPGTANVASHGADRLAEGADLDMNATVTVEMVDGATAATPQHA